MSKQKERYALLSVYDKTGIVEFARALSDLDFKIISTGGTAKILEDNKIPVIPIQEITGNPESFDGRMKTISFQIESGILFDRSKNKHVEEARTLKIKPIDLVVCNLYPFEETVSKKGVTLEEAVENIDVGGPTMVRSAAKNFKDVLVVTDPSEYSEAIERLQTKQDSMKYRQTLAAKAFSHLSFYDSQIAAYLNTETFAGEVTIPGRKVVDFRYGDNPHQAAAGYITPNSSGLINNLKHISGRELSLTNFTDINAGYEVVRLFAEPCAVVIKHNNPCGIALGATASLALSNAIQADPESAFGGVVVTNRSIDAETAKQLVIFKEKRGSMMDIVSAPSITEQVLEILKNVRKTTGIYMFGAVKSAEDKPYFKSVDGGFILQTADADIEKSFKDWKVVTQKKPTQKQLENMQTGWKFVSRVKSNAILVMDSKLPMTRGIGTGQTSRVRATKIALSQAGEHAKGGVLVSDSFFPFGDSVELAAKHGIKAIVQQGGSVRDKDSIDSANKHGITMVFTNRRAFWH